MTEVINVKMTANEVAELTKGKPCGDTVSDLEMEYLVFGKGTKTFVLLPGVSLRSIMPTGPIIEAGYNIFCEEYRVYVFDRRKNAPEGYTIREMVRDTAAVMKKQGIGDAYVDGASQGGMMACLFGIDYPELVKKLVLTCTMARVGKSGAPELDNWMRILDEKGEDGPDTVRLVTEMIDAIYTEATLKMCREQVIATMSNLSDEELTQFERIAKACFTYDCYGELDRITCPTLVIGAEGDKVIPVECSKELAEALNCESYIYGKEWGHGVYDEAPDYKKLVYNFFEK